MYPALMTAQQISRHVMKSKDIRESKELDDHLQRDLKPRVKKIVSYLKSRESHFFNSILLGIFDAPPDWAEFDLSGPSEKLQIGKIDESQSSMGLLLFTGEEKIFAIDGQHRAEAIHQAYLAEAEAVKNDQYPVLFLGHIDTKEGRVRTRRLFCDINIHAVAVSKGDKVIINEDDLSAIVTRRVFSEYPNFKNGELIALTEKVEQIENRHFTNLLGLYIVCQALRKLFQKRKGVPEVHADNVTGFKQVVIEFWDFVINHEQSLNDFFVKGKTTPARERKTNRSLMFRPIGLELLARLYVYFYKSNKLSLFGWALENLTWSNPGGIWDGTLWVSGKIQTKPKAQAYALVLHVLGELSQKDSMQLKEKMKELTRNDKYELPERVSIPAAFDIRNVGKSKK